MGGLFGGIVDLVHGKGPEQQGPSGAFQDVDEVGEGYSSYLKDVLGGRLGESDRFGRMASVLRDYAGNVSRTQRGQATQYSQDKGFMDSGSLLDMFGEIDRNEIESYTNNLEELLFGMEQQGLASVFEFLGGASNEYMGLAGLNTGNLMGERQMNSDKGTAVASMIMGGFGAGGVTGGGEGGKPPACWVARSVYGADDPRWLIARHYVVHMAPRPFYRFYLKHGEKIAAWLDGHPWAKRFVKPIFDWMVRKVLK